MKMPLFINLLGRKLFVILLNQKKLQGNTILQEPFQQLIQNLEHCIFIHITKQRLYQNGQILKLTLINTINIADGLEGFLDPLASLLRPHALGGGQNDHVLEGFGQPVGVVQVLLC